MEISAETHAKLLDTIILSDEDQDQQLNLEMIHKEGVGTKNVQLIPGHVMYDTNHLDTEDPAFDEFIAGNKKIGKYSLIAKGTYIEKGIKVIVPSYVKKGYDLPFSTIASKRNAQIYINKDQGLTVFQPKELITNWDQVKEFCREHKVPMYNGQKVPIK